MYIQNKNQTSPLFWSHCISYFVFLKVQFCNKICPILGEYTIWTPASHIQDKLKRRGICTSVTKMGGGGQTGGWGCVKMLNNQGLEKAVYTCYITRQKRKLQHVIDIRQKSFKSNSLQWRSKYRTCAVYK